MAFMPKFIVTSIKERRRPAPPGVYTGGSSTDPLWQVQMKSGFFKGVGVTFSYEEKNRAENFAPWEIYDPSTIIRQAAPASEPFVVQDVYKTKGYEGKNRYTDRAQFAESWTVSMESAYGNYIDLWYPNPGQAYRFPKGRSYKIQDLFGTLPAALAPINSQVDDAARAAAEAAAAARAAAEAAAAAQAAYDAALAAAQAAQAAYESALAAAGAAQSAANAYAVQQANQAAAAHAAVAQEAQNSALRAQLVADDQARAAAQALTGSTTFLLQTADNQQLQYWIANGGASGWYFVGTATQLHRPGVTAWAPNANSIRTTMPDAYGDYTHYNAGTFNRPSNGLLVGAFQSD